MKTIYVISDRYYSEGGNVVAFEDRALAEAVCEIENRAKGNGYFTEEIEVYEQAPDHKPCYHMVFVSGRRPFRSSLAQNRDGSFQQPETPGFPSADRLEELTIWPWSGGWPPDVECKSDHWQNHLSVYGTDLEKVRKTYSDLKAQMVAQGEIWLDWEPAENYSPEETEETGVGAHTRGSTVSIPGPIVQVTDG
jgi:hypothetical protein